MQITGLIILSKLDMYDLSKSLWLLCTLNLMELLRAQSIIKFLHIFSALLPQFSGPHLMDTPPRNLFTYLPTPPPPPDSSSRLPQGFLNIISNREGSDSYSKDGAIIHAMDTLLLCMISIIDQGLYMTKHATFCARP